MALFSVTGWYQWVQDLSIPRNSIWGSFGQTPAVRIYIPLTIEHRSWDYPYFPYQESTRMILLFLVPVGLALGIAESIRQNRVERRPERSTAT